MGVVPVLFILPGLGDIYYVAVQRCPQALMPLVRISAIGLLLHPLTLAMRGYLEGKAAYLKKPTAILAGHTIYFISLTCTALACIAVGIPGNLQPALAFFAANIAAAFTMQILIARRKGQQPESLSPDAANKESRVQETM